jgi:hypothetical protein
MLNLNIPHFYGYMRKEHMYQHKDHIGEFVKVTVFAAQSNPDRALLFHVLTDDGLVRSRVPVHMLCHKETAPQLPLDYLQLWDCFSVNCTVVVYDYLKASRIQVVLKDKQKLWGEYMMTFDWYGNPYSDEPTQYKSLHMIRLDNGCYTLQPNNRVYWKHMSFVTNPFPANPDFKVDDKVFRCEAVSDRWLIDGDDNSYYYNLKNETVNSSIEKSK